MNNFGNFSNCMVDAGQGEHRQTRVSGSALAASGAIEIAAVAVLLLWPLVAPAVLPPETQATPVPLLKGPLVADSNHRHDARNSHQRPRTTTFTDRVFHQPLSIPALVAQSASVDQPDSDLIDDAVRMGRPGTDVLGAGQGANVPAPRATPPRMISKGVMDAFLVERVQPEYPATAKMIHLSGAVQLRAVIGIDGRIRHLVVVSGNPILAQAAVAAVRLWRYEPTRLNGEPVEVLTQITVNFVFE
ncbi:MAG TPA: energy transducer TonB [Candidatus Acidoferrales bacterium]